eukprot:12280867-Karenia_brevis.AAC.1
MAYFDGVASAADAACARGDSKQIYRLAKNVSSYRPKAIKAVTKADGNLTVTPDEYDERWVEFFTGLFAGRNTS